MTDSDHVNTQLDAIARLTFQQWFNGRAAYVRAFRPVAADFGEQAMRADYIADKAWWYRLYEPATHPTLAAAVAAASRELPTPTGPTRSMRRGWLEKIDITITGAARHVPSHQWATTLIPGEVIAELRRSAP